MTHSPAQVHHMFELVEPIATVTFSDAVNEAFLALGMRNYWDGYFAGRAAPLGLVPADVVDAVFFNFAGGEVARHIPWVWRKVTPEQAIAVRERASAAELQRRIRKLADSSDLARVADLATRAAFSAPVEGRILYAAHRALAVPEEPVARLCHAANLLREHRGDGHNAALVAHGIGRTEAHVLMARHLGQLWGQRGGNVPGPARPRNGSVDALTEKENQMSTTTPTGPLADVRDMYVVHRAFRREFGLVPALIRRVAPGDAARAEVVAAHLDLVLAGLHMHHTGEDTVLWPLLLERAAPEAELIATMQTQHEGVDSYADQIGVISAEWRTSGSAVRGEQLAQLVEDFRTALVEHLDLEEREILPLAARHVTATEWDSLGDHGVEVMTKSQLPLMFGAVLQDADEAERAMMLGKLPLPVRVLLNTLGRWQYRRYVTRVHGG